MPLLCCIRRPVPLFRYLLVLPAMLLVCHGINRLLPVVLALSLTAFVQPASCCYFDGMMTLESLIPTGCPCCCANCNVVGILMQKANPSHFLRQYLCALVKCLQYEMEQQSLQQHQ